MPQQFDATRGAGHDQHGPRTSSRTSSSTTAPAHKGDYDTPEQRIGGFQIDRPWETCMTICHQWAWKPNDKMKSLKECLQTLIRTNGGDGNLLFNVGPQPDGVIEARQVERLKEMGAWLAKNGEAVYDTRGGPWKPSSHMVSTRKGDKIYLHLLSKVGWSRHRPRPASRHQVRETAQRPGHQNLHRRWHALVRHPGQLMG